MNSLGTILAGLHQGKFQVFRGQDLGWYFHLKAPNGEIICASQGYSSREAALHGVQAVRTYAQAAPVEG